MVIAFIGQYNINKYGIAAVLISHESYFNMWLYRDVYTYNIIAHHPKNHNLKNHVPMIN